MNWLYNPLHCRAMVHVIKIGSVVCLSIFLLPHKVFCLTNPRLLLKWNSLHKSIIRIRHIDYSINHSTSALFRFRNQIKMLKNKNTFPNLNVNIVANSEKQSKKELATNDFTDQHHHKPPWSFHGLSWSLILKSPSQIT